MAVQARRITAYLGRLNSITYKSQFQFQFSTFNLLPDPSNKDEFQNPPTIQPPIDKSHVLNQLSDLLPIRRRTTVPEHLTLTSLYEQLEVRAVDGFLTPEEKLRGVFIQKLIGKTAIEQALSNTRVELIVDIVAKVVNKGNLGGEAMVMFFDWATKQPTIDKGIDCYHVIFKAQGRRKFFDHMVGVLHDMKMEGTSPVLDTWEIVMDGNVRARQVSKAIRMFGQLEEFGSKCDTESLNVLPTVLVPTVPCGRCKFVP